MAHKNPQQIDLLRQVYSKSEYTKVKFNEYYQNYSKCFEGLDNFVNLYESRKQKA